MARHSAEQIYGFARSAGFSPDQAATMTAIALAESGGSTRAHNSSGEDSRGLWQINASAHPDLAARYDLYDPVQNARAAWEVSRHGADISPWTTAHGGSSARYLRYRAQAESAGAAHGDGTGLGMWSGVAGYGSTTAAGPGGGNGGGTALDPAFDPAFAVPEGGESADVFLRSALAQVGDSYVFGAEASSADVDPDTFDCSELVEWAAAQADVTVPDGSYAQYLWAKERGYVVPVEQAEQVPGALLFSFSSEPTPSGGRPSQAHVAISQGDGRTVEARSPADGVLESTSAGRFNFAAVIPGLAGGEPGTLVDTEADRDRDGLTDVQERAQGLDPLGSDTDGDGLSDGHEVVTTGTDPRLADTDGDSFGDAFELARGLDPTQPDTEAGLRLDGPADGSTDGEVLTALAPAAGSVDGGPDGTDSDGDGLADDLEQRLGLDPTWADSDGDGYRDGLEHHAGSDPLSAASTPLDRAAAGSDDLDL